MEVKEQNGVQPICLVDVVVLYVIIMIVKNHEMNEYRVQCGVKYMVQKHLGVKKLKNKIML
jgi:hypothetical protein